MKTRGFMYSTLEKERREKFPTKRFSNELLYQIIISAVSLKYDEPRLRSFWRIFISSIFISLMKSPFYFAFSSKMTHQRSSASQCISFALTLFVKCKINRVKQKRDDREIILKFGIGVRVEFPKIMISRCGCSFSFFLCGNFVDLW